MKVRNPYVDPLNVLQAEIMKRLRKDTAAVAGGAVQTPAQKEQRITLEDALIVSVNGIAQGMKNSG
jgi:phosphoenolpyruvate carboxylase